VTYSNVEIDEEFARLTKDTVLGLGCVGNGEHEMPQCVESSQLILHDLELVTIARCHFQHFTQCVDCTEKDTKALKSGHIQCVEAQIRTQPLSEDVSDHFTGQ
jgi:hypothetical protein